MELLLVGRGAARLLGPVGSSALPDACFESDYEVALGAEVVPWRINPISREASAWRAVGEKTPVTLATPLRMMADPQ